MYLTLIQKSKQTIQNDYTSFLNQTNTPEEYYSLTLDIEKPRPYDKLTTAQTEHIINTVIALQKCYEILKPFEENTENYYYSFKIPKRSGGLRTINAPVDEFKEALSKVKDIFEYQIKCLPHNSAFAYIKHKSVEDAIVKHQQNKSQWFLKIDLKDFFPNCTPEFIFKQLMQLYPFYYMGEESQIRLQKIINICCLNNGLPQGTPMSPLLTNLVMVPYDYAINKHLKRFENNHFVYTRYADDILISSKSAFNWRTIQDTLTEMLVPFEINTTKTRYGSRAGSNWNLGLMLNKDNNITIGHQKKKTINAMLNNFLKDGSENIRWPKEDIYHLQGLLSYLNHIEPGYYSYIANKYSKKYNIKLKTAFKTALNS